jgi:peroxiredoxin
MKTFLTSCLTLAAFAAVALAAPEVGQPAPEFTLTDSTGTAHRLSDFKGKTVVLEWLNHGCPFVRKQYDSGNMQKLQKKYTGEGVVWLSIVSSASGKQGHMTADDTNKTKAEKGAAPSAILLDEDGTVGQLYAAKVTPELFIIDPKGTLVYAGGIDDKKSTDPADIATSKNYVAAALDELLAGKPVSQAKTEAYGCSVKY